MTIESILVEPLARPASRGPHAGPGAARCGRAAKDAGSRYPREFSGGQRQRVAIARALAMNPAVIVCDEPTSALDVTTQARVLTLLEELQKATGVAYLFISHDLGVVNDISDRIAVLYRGEIVEIGEAKQVALAPRNDYTRLQSAPVADPKNNAHAARSDWRCSPPARTRSGSPRLRPPEPPGLRLAAFSAVTVELLRSTTYPEIPEHCGLASRLSPRPAPTRKR